jgi:hypothetical protein
MAAEKREAFIHYQEILTVLTSVETKRGSHRKASVEFQINKSMLIIKGQAQSLSSVENFLRNREWKIFSTTSLKDALVYLVSQQPMFVLISIDHPNKKVQNLPRVLAQAFPVCAVTFAENATPSAYKTLNTSKHEYKLFPPVTGPAVERIVNKYAKDQTQKATNQQAISQWTNGEGGPDSIAVKGGGADGTINVRGGENGFNSSTAQALLASMLGGDSAALGEATNAANQAGFISGSGDGGMSDAEFAAALAKAGGDNAAQLNALNSNDIQGMQKGAGMGSPLGSAGEGIGAGSKLGTAADGIGAGQMINPAEQDPTKNKSSDPSYSLEDFDKSALDHWSHSHKEKENSAGGGWAPVEKKQKEKALPSDEFAEKFKGKLEVDNLIGQGVQKSLDESVVRFKNPEKQVIQDSSNVSCIIIVSPRFSGYLVTAMGKNKKIDEEFIEKVRLKLFKFLKDRGENVSDDERSMDMKIKQVNFEEWAAESAEFLKKSVHQGNEVAMAFFPKPDVKTEFKESAAQEMLAVDLKEIKTDVPLEFNVYLYLPRNSKYVLYTPEGGIMFKHQKDKLQREGVNEVHVLKEDAEQVDSHRAKSYLEATIDIMNQRKGFNKAS